MLKTLSVSELSSYISNIFDAEELLHGVKVFGEVSGLSFVRGNLYFNLKDENALISCIMFGTQTKNIKDGDQVVVTGSLRYYAKMGRLSFYISAVVPYGSGDLYQKFLELTNKLRTEGVFDESHKKPLPKLISKIGVVTSITGAVLHDIQKVVHRRNPLMDIVIFPSKVQGEGAEKTIIQGIKYFDQQKDIDVIIIARGGGSLEDLAPFNTESLARAIIKISKPIVSAVGHQSDITICDLASSLRAATPSEAGELVAKNMYDGIDKFKNNLEKLFYLQSNILDEKYDLIDRAKSQANLLFSKVYRTSFDKTKTNILKLKTLDSISTIENRLSIDEATLRVLDPLETLKRGYARLIKGKRVVNSVKMLENEDEICAEFLDGNAEILVKKISEVKQ